jgi:hypothetical protein
MAAKAALAAAEKDRSRDQLQRRSGVLKFSISAEEHDKILAFKKEQDEKWIAARGADKGPFHFGAIGGSMTYSFTPTTLGTILKVTHCTGAELDVTNYNEW